MSKPETPTNKPNEGFYPNAQGIEADRLAKLELDKQAKTRPRWASDRPGGQPKDTTIHVYDHSDGLSMDPREVERRVLNNVLGSRQPDNKRDLFDLVLDHPIATAALVIFGAPIGAVILAILSAIAAPLPLGSIIGAFIILSFAFSLLAKIIKSFK